MIHTVMTSCCEGKKKKMRCCSSVEQDKSLQQEPSALIHPLKAFSPVLNNKVPTGATQSVTRRSGEW